MARKTVKTNKAIKFDLEQILTDKVLDALDKGVVGWQRPWVSLSEPHRNLAYNRAYRGLLNQLLLTLASMENGWDRPYWLTYEAAAKMGGQVRKGEKGTMVTFYKRIKVQDRNSTDPDATKMIPLLKYFKVFNVAQIDGIEDKVPAKPETTANGADISEQAEAIIEGYNGPEIHYGGNRAAYAPLLDKVLMPNRDQFHSTEGFYGTIFHELGHSTGHKSRKNRKELYSPGFGTDLYSVEELTAEMVAVFLSGHAGFEPDIDNSAAYIDGWRKALTQDKSLIVKASTKASAATDLILGVEYESDEGEGAIVKGKGDN